MTVRRCVATWLTIAVMFLGVAPAHGATSWTVRVPTLNPTWIFPFQSGETYSGNNVNGFQQLMYRPLYWISANPTVRLNRELSLANAPVFSDHNTKVTITLRPQARWSNGTPVRAGDVLFFMNLMAAMPGTWAAYSPPLRDGTPLNLIDMTESVATPNDATVVLRLHRPVNPSWFLFNQLSQITPLPQAWDRRATSTLGAAFPEQMPSRYDVQRGRLATTAGGCWGAPWIGNGNRGPLFDAQRLYARDTQGVATIVPDAYASRARGCVYVKATLDAFANDLTHLARRTTDTGRLWSIVSGPWQLASFSATHHTATFRRREDVPVVQGPSELRYVTCPRGCLAAALRGSLDWFNVTSQVLGRTNGLDDIGSLQLKSLADAGFEIHASYPMSIDYVALNFASKNGANRHAAAVFRQTYIRQSLQDAIDQRRMIEKRFQGFAVPGTGPLPIDDPHQKVPKAHVRRALTRLQDHGWRLEGGVMTCRHRGTDERSCGRGIPEGTRLEFDFLTATNGGGIVRDLKRSWRSIGVRVVVSSVSFNDVVSTAFGHSTNWDMAEWGGWLYAPGYLTTGESLFSTGASTNAGSYSNPKADRLIAATISSTDPAALSRYAAFIAKDVPVLWLPSAITLTEVRSSFHDTPSRVGEFTPERWRR